MGWEKEGMLSWSIVATGLKERHEFSVLTWGPVLVVKAPPAPREKARPRGGEEAGREADSRDINRIYLHGISPLNNRNMLRRVYNVQGNTTQHGFACTKWNIIGQ